MVKKVIKYIFYLLLIPFSYLIVSLVLSAITIDRKEDINSIPDNIIYLASNGVHLDIVIPKESIDSTLLSHLIHKPGDNYLAFGWGDEEFYLNTPTWADLSFVIAFKALFLNGPSLIHITRYRKTQNHWIEVKLTESELRKLNIYLYQTFDLNKNGEVLLIKNKGYSSRDNFYKAKESFTFYKTCNSWVNTGFKQSGLKSCLWTPFDIGLMNKYR